ncbi:MAG: IS630 family transposase [Micrococcales bacterium]|nr:IS630 family transposase [Micrococcales bacterium]
MLEKTVRSASVPAGTANRVRIVLLAADGLPNAAISATVGVTVNTVRAWRARYETYGVVGLVDRARPGRPRSVDRAAVVAATLAGPPKSHGTTHWTTRALGRRLGVSNAEVAAVWAEYGVQPWRRGTFRFSTDPQLEAKAVDVVGLYLDPPADAVVLCVVDESQIQVLDRIQPLLPTHPGQIGRGTLDYVCHSTTCLFAALDTATGQVLGAPKPRRSTREFLAFCKQVARACPDQDLHLVMDNYATNKHEDVQAWLAANPRIHVHFTPTHASWLNMVEVFFGLMQRRALDRGVFRPVADLNTALRRFVNHHDKDAHSFVWTKTTAQVLPETKPSTTSPMRH